MSARHCVQWRVFKCLRCGSIAHAPKRGIKNRTGKGHFKRIWCYRCKDRTNHIQIS